MKKCDIILGGQNYSRICRNHAWDSAVLKHFLKKKFENMEDECKNNVNEYKSFCQSTIE